MQEAKLSRVVGQRRGPSLSQLHYKLSSNPEQYTAIFSLIPQPLTAISVPAYAALLDAFECEREALFADADDFAFGGTPFLSPELMAISPINLSI